ncbi:MAG: Hpt domain-containing protein, partial [Pseudomonadota bacterium]
EMLRQMAHEIVEPGGLKMPETAQPSAPKAEPEPEPSREPEKRPEPSAEEPSKAEPTEMPELDPVLLEIYSKEAEGHLEEIEKFIAEWREGGSHKVTEPLIRALHTLQGSSRMAGVMSVAEVAASLEKYAKTLQGNHHGVEQDGIEALEACLSYIRAMLSYLIDGEGELPDGSEPQRLADTVYADVQHMEEAANAQPEAGLAAHEEQVAEEASKTEEPRPEPEAAEEIAEPEADAEATVAEVEAPGTDEQHKAQPEEPAQAEAPTAPTASAPAPTVVEEEYDPELLEIFLEEGADILDASEETLQEWVDNPDDRSLVESLQRQLHTLKGGARMAGIKPIGDLSHSLESTFEAVVEGRIQRSPQMMDLLQLSHDRLVTMLEQVGSHEPVVTGDDLIHQVEVIASGGELEAPLAEPEAPVSEAAEAPVKTAEVEAAAEEAAPIGEAEQSEAAPGAEQQAEPPVSKVKSDPYKPVEAAVSELEVNHSSWLRDVDDQEIFGQLLQSAADLAEACREAGLEPLAELAAAVDRLLNAIIDGHVPASKKASDMVSLAMDRIRHDLQRVRQQQPLEGAQFLIADVDELIARSRAEEEGAVPQQPEEAEHEQTKEPAAEPAEKPEQPAQKAQKAQPEAESKAEERKRRTPRIQHEMVRVRADLLDNLVNFAGEVSIYRSRVEQQIGSFRSNIGEMDQTVDRLREQVRQVEIENEAQIESRREEAQKQGYEDFDPLEFDRFTHMQQLSRSMAESLSDLMSIEEILSGLTRETETLLLQQSRVNTELQENLVHTRMVPLVENAPRLRRIVRQTAAEVGKRASLSFDGAEVEMDRNVVERMMAPLEHMLRNSVAHGIEEKLDRTKAGKAEEGKITIGLSREGSEIVIRVSDDGRGIDLDVVKNKAIERGLVKPDAKLSDKEIMRFILESGFSTAESLSQIAGRGVGMDVVNSEIKQLGGVMDIDSVQGKGTTFTVRIPLTLSVSRALLVQVAEDTYAIPLMSIRGIERIETGELERLLSSEDPVFTWMGEEYDLMHLTSVLGLGQGQIGSELAKQPLLLARSGDSRIALAVDSLLGSREIVVKSLGPQLSTLQDLSGATILADGSVALIIDMPSLIRRGLAHKSRMAAASEEVAVPETEREPVVMVVDDSITVRKVTERLLKRNNMICVTAKDGVDALSVLEETMPDVMLLDIEMPRMDGFELATHMRNSDRLHEIPIIMITSRTGEKHRQRALDIGVNIYMGKPYTEVDLLENIETLLGKRS